MRSFVGLTILALLAFTPRPALAQEQRLVVIPGRIVVDSDAPLPQFGALDARDPAIPLRLALTTGSVDRRFMHDTAGTFLANLPEGRYAISLGSAIADRNRIISFTYGNVDLLTTPATIRADDPHELVLRLKPPPGNPARIRGRVAENKDLPSTKDPLRVSAYLGYDNIESNAYPMETVLRPDGSFEFPKLFPGRYRIQIPNVTNILSVDVAGNEISNIVLTPRPPSEANAPYVPLAWHVVVEGGYPPPQFEVFMTGPSTLSQSPVSSPPQTDGTYRTYAQKGEYRIRLAPLPSRYQLQSMTAGMTDLLTDPLILSGTEPVLIVLNVSVTNPDDWITLNGRIRGLTNLPGARPEAALEIIEQGNNSMRIAPSRPQPDGTLETRRVLPGTYRLAFHVRDTDGNFPMAMAQTIAVSKESNPPIDLSIPPMTTIRGRIVVDGQAPLPCLSLFVPGDYRTFNMECRSDGSFTISVPIGEYAVQASGFPMGYMWLKSLTFGDSDLLKQNIRLATTASSNEMKISLGAIAAAPMSSVRGRVVKTPGVSRILVVGTNGGRYETSVNPDGAFEFPILLPGIYTALTVPHDSAELGVRFTVSDRRVTEVEVKN